MAQLIWLNIDFSLFHFTITPTSMFCLKRDDVCSKPRTVCMWCTAYCAPTAPSSTDRHRLQWKNQEGTAPSCGHVFTDSCFWFWVVFKWMMKKSLVYSGYLKWKENGERWKTSGLQTWASEVNLSERKKKKKRGVPHALPILFSINLLLLGKHACFRETTFVTFSPFTDLSLKLSTAGAPVSAQRNQMTNQGRPLCSVFLRRLPTIIS